MAQATLLGVACPHCMVGRLTAVIVKQDGAESIEGLGQPHQCPACQHWVRFQIRLHVVGVPLPAAGPTTPQGDFLRRLVAQAST